MDKLAGVHPELVTKVRHLLDAMTALGFPMVVTAGVRSAADQRELYEQGRSTPGAIVTNADGERKKSNHQAHADGFGHAVDCAFVDERGQPTWDDRKPWTAYGACAKALGLAWGGDWQALKDRPHIELLGLLLALLTLASVARADTLPMGIPDFCVNPSISAAHDGPWSNPATWAPARVPVAGDVVSVPAGKTVSYDVVSDAAMACVGVHGVLFHQTNINTRLTTGNLLFYTGGEYDIGTLLDPVRPDVVAELVIADRPLNPQTDPEQYGTAFLGLGGKLRIAGASKTQFHRMARELSCHACGPSTIALEAAPAGWRAGDDLVVPATEQWFLDVGAYTATWETPTLTGVSGTTITTTALAYAHAGARDQTGALRYLPHVGNLTRNVIVRSANPNGTRGHVLFTARADVDIRYAEFKDLGRTTVAPLDNDTNHLARYGVHFHHLQGPLTPQTNGRQFTFMGNAVRNSTKWGVDVHDAHYGLVQDNVIFDSQGAGLMAEDGSETGNIFDRNFIVVALGPGHGGFGTLAEWGTGGSERGDNRDVNLAADKGWEGSGIWLRGPGNIVRNNVIANTNSFAIALLMSHLDTIQLPAFQGADRMVDGVTTNMYTVPMAPFENNEIYGSLGGATIWEIGVKCCSEFHELPVSTLKNTVLWHVSKGYYGYGHNRLTFDGWTQLGSIQLWSWSSYVNDYGIWFGDYPTRNQVLRNLDIEGMRVGLRAPYKPGDVSDIYGPVAVPTLIENSFFNNEFNVAMGPMYAVGGGDGSLPPRLTLINNVRFGALNMAVPEGPEWTPCNICMGFATNLPNVNIIQKDEVKVSNYNGVAGDNFQVFYREQAPNFIVPQSSDGVTGAPVAGLTNAQLWAQHGIAIAGAVAPCATTRAGIQGFVCSSGGGQVTPQPPGAAIVTY